MNRRLAAVIEALITNHFIAEHALNSEAAKQRVLELIPQDAVVGVGNSATLRQIGVLRALEERGTKVINPIIKETTQAGAEVLERALRETLGRDVFLGGTNAITLDGKLVNIDRSGNRIAGIVFGAPRVIVVVGRNKIVDDVDEAVKRIKNVITPVMMKVRGRKTPCASLGRCADCKTEHRACNIIQIIEKRPYRTELIVILVDEDLGLGWDPTWPQSRIGQIYRNYKAFDWVYSPEKA